MAHHMTNMAGVKNPADGLGEAVTWIDDTGNLGKKKMSGLLQILEGKMFLCQCEENVLLGDHHLSF
jgi:hypothetical protein